MNPNPKFLGFLARAEPDLGQLESAYRKHFLSADANQIRVTLPIYVVAIWLSLLIDAQLHNVVLLYFQVFLTIVTLWLYRFLALVQSVRALDYCLLLWSVCAYSLPLMVNYTHTTYNTSGSVMTVLLTYLMFPSLLIYRFIPTLLFTIAEITISVVSRSATDPTEVGIGILMILLANFIGYILSIRLFTFRRNQYKAQLNEQQARAEIERLANTDALTQIANRRYFLELGNQELLRQKYGFTLLYLDIDFFKQINDTYGHAMGDLILQQFAALVLGQIRSTDIFGRLGGEEFALLVPETSLETAQEVAERIRVSCENTVFGTGIQSVTVSSGLTVSLPSDSSIEEVLQRADRGLYQAKQLGRNRVEIT